MLGLKKAIIALLNNRHGLYYKDSYSWTPLSWAAARGHETIVKQLLEKGAKLESNDNNNNSWILLL